MHVLVSGGCGFLGSHVCEYFRKEKWKVTSIDNLTTYEFTRSGYKASKARLYNRNFLKSIGVEVRLEDTRNWDSIRLFKPDYIVHTAAQPTMTLSIEAPRYDLENNVLGTFNMLELARLLDIPIATCSTIHIYGNKINRLLKEEETRFTCTPKSIGEEYDILNGDISPLHASKRSGELYGLAYIDTYGLKVGIMRLSGMYGTRQFAGMHHGWVSNFIIRTLKKLPIYIFRTSKQVRDILYCTDAGRLFYNFYKYQEPGLYTVGGGEKNAVSLLEVLNMIKEISRIEQNIIIKEKRFGDLYYFVANITKAKRYLNWQPEISPRRGLEETIKWVGDNLDLFEGIK